MSGKPRPAGLRLLEQMDLVPGSRCWRWTGSSDRQGYGRIGTTAGKNTAAHRIAYETFVGAIPAGLVIDHLCRNKWCVNPDHLEPVTQAENVRRWARSLTSCRHGHAYPDNLRRTPSGSPYCAECNRIRARKNRSAA